MRRMEVWFVRKKKKRKLPFIWAMKDEQDFTGAKAREKKAMGKIWEESNVL